MKRLLFTAVQFTWGILQNALGFLIFLCLIRRPHRTFHGAVVTEWRRPMSAALGLFIFLSERAPEELLVHEYGHTIQSMILGPLFLPVIGIPSALWANSRRMHTRRHDRHISYYSLYTERWANHLGEKYLGENSMGQAFID